MVDVQSNKCDLIRNKRWNKTVMMEKVITCNMLYIMSYAVTPT